MKPRYTVPTPTDDGFGIQAAKRWAFVVNKLSLFTINKRCADRVNKKQSSSFHIPNQALLLTTGNGVDPGQKIRHELRNALLKIRLDVRI